MNFEAPFWTHTIENNGSGRNSKGQKIFFGWTFSCKSDFVPRTQFYSDIIVPFTPPQSHSLASKMWEDTLTF